MPTISKPCHNCRRRRLRCDRSWPSCHKCAVSGQECLGYGRVFVWTQAIDAQKPPKPSPAPSSDRNKGQQPLLLQQQRQPQRRRQLGDGSENNNAGGGWESPNPPPAAGGGAGGGDERAAKAGAGRGAGAGAGLGAGAGGGVRQALAGDQHQQDSSGHGFKYEYELPGNADEGRHHDHDHDHGAVHQHQPRRRGPALSAPPSLGTAVGSALDDTLERPSVQQRQASWMGSGRVPLGNLTDPVFQDLDRNSRYYLAHFADRVCKDLVARDAPGINPFRELIPLTNRHPLLLHILVATSAIHWSNIFRPITAIPTGLTDPGGYLAQLRSKDLVSRQALIDALTAKQKAMGHLREVLDTLDPAGSEVALAAMHFFVKFDLIDLERNDDRGWQTHLEGASSILALLAPGSGASSSSRVLRDCVIADCFIYHILGSTLASGALAARIARYAFELLPVMKRVEVNSYLSCPSEILQVILVASQISYETPCTDWSLSAADEALALIDQALAFDILAWAAQLQRQPNVTDIESRVHVASAHRSAACLYILQALPLVRAVRPVDTDFLVGDILGHLGQIGETDPYFKATSWPTFIAGAETRDAEKRTWSLKRLLAIWEICSWGYIFTAIEMLKATWAMQDRDANGKAAVPGVNWLQGLRDMGFDYLIV